MPMRPTGFPYTVLLAAAIGGWTITAPAAADPVHTEHVDADLIAENAAFTVKGENWAALRLKPESGWHTYWRNPGDSGIATSLAWTLPPGVTTGDIQWPYPHRVVLGDIVNYGYDGETLHMVRVTLPADWPADRPVELRAKAKWLVCKDICIPGSAEVALTLPVAETPPRNDTVAAAFAAARAQLPQPAPADWKPRFDTDKTDFTLGLPGTRISASGGVAFFPYANDLLNHSAPARMADVGKAGDKDGLRLSQKLSDFFTKPPAQVDGVLEVHDGDSTKAWEIHAQPGDLAPVPLSAAPAPAAAATEAQPRPLALILLLALGGGLILNLMPCVFPVLSIKAIAIVESRDRNRGRKILNAFAYTAGVLATFIGLATILLVLRGSGTAIGWGFQLQQPAFVAALAYLFFAMGLSMSGVVEFGTRWMGVGQSLSEGSGARGAFFTGVLAVVVASPCTAPFMGAALGYALAQPAAVALLVFAALGLGLALPLPLIGLVPAFGRLLPRPGAWMNTFRQFMAFPLYLTAVWLLWVLGGLTDRSGMAIALVGVTLIAFALWLWHRPDAMSRLLKIAAIVLALALLATPQFRDAGSTKAAAGEHEAWSAARVDELRAQKRTIFVNFTADWCITCKFNERVALTSTPVREAFAKGQVTWLEGDWTRSDPAITAVLSKFGRSGVPLYLVYVEGGEPKVLPQILTPDIVLAAIRP